MNWTDLLTGEMESTYAVTEKLLSFVDDRDLGWKPSTGNNWMTMGQLLKHLGEGCGAAFRGFIAGEWPWPAGTDPSALMQLPTAEQLPAVASVAEARQLIEADRRVAFEMLQMRDEERLDRDRAPAPWDASDMVLGQRLLQMVEHLKQHKGQLFYYLKLQGKPVSTADLWGGM
jgi:uncharacterized damage-inducible protein DinB